MPRPVYFDCDTGVDDALALAYLLASPEISLAGIGCVHGNVNVAQGTENTLRLLALAGRRDIPVAIGAAHPLIGDFPGGSPHVHGANGIGDVEIEATDLKPAEADAPDLLLDLSHAHPGELEIIAVGPLTNLALALERDPSLVERIAQVTVMGGAALCPGNISPVAEANIAHDPEAASAVFGAGWQVTLVGLDTTLENVLEDGHRLAMLDSGDPLLSAIGEIFDEYFDFYVSVYGRRSCALHDPLAAAIGVGAMVPRVAPRVPVVVDTGDGPGRGQTICDLRGQRPGWRDRDGANVRVVLETEGELAPHLLERLGVEAAAPLIDH